MSEYFGMVCIDCEVRARALKAEKRASEMRDEIASELVDAAGMECALCIYWRKEGEDKHPVCKDCLLNGGGDGVQVAFDEVGTGRVEEGEPTATIPRLYHLWQKAETRLQAVRVALDKQLADTDKAYEQGHIDARMAYEAGLWDEEEREG